MRRTAPAAPARAPCCAAAAASPVRGGTCASAGTGGIDRRDAARRRRRATRARHRAIATQLARAQIDRLQRHRLRRERLQIRDRRQRARGIAGRHRAELRHERAIRSLVRLHAERGQPFADRRARAADDDVARGELRAQRREVAFDDHCALAQHADAVAQPVELGELVAADQHRDAVVGGEAAQQRLEVGDAFGVEAVGRFVEQQHARPAEQRLRDAQALAHAHRERADLAVRRGDEPGAREHAVGFGAGERPRHALQPRERDEVLPRRRVQVEARPLDQGAALRLRRARLCDRVDAEHTHAATRRSQQAQREPHHRRLARAIVAEEAIAIAGVQRQRHAAHRRAAAIGEVEVAQFEGRRHGAAMVAAARDGSRRSGGSGHAARRRPRRARLDVVPGARSGRSRPAGVWHARAMLPRARAPQAGPRRLPPTAPSLGVERARTDLFFVRDGTGSPRRQLVTQRTIAGVGIMPAWRFCSTPPAKRTSSGIDCTS